MEVSKDHLFNPPAAHHEKHWLAYGNVVLVAVSSKKPVTTLFRIHSSLLSEHSEVFASMFELPQGEAANQTEMYEGLPLVRLPDSSEEVCGLLDALRDPLRISVRNKHSDTPLRIRDALHMATKYLMTSLRANLVRILESEWPLTLEDLELKDQLFLDYINHPENGLRDDPCYFPGWPLHFVPEPAAAIELAEQYDIPSILPAAYYDAMRCSPRKDWDEGFTPYFCMITEKPARWGRLSGKSYRKIHYLADTFYGEEMPGVCGGLESLEPTVCSQPDAEPCREIWRKLVKDNAFVSTKIRERDLFQQLRDLREDAYRSKLCRKCCDAYSEAVVAARDEAWLCFQDLCWGEEYR